MFIIKRSHFLFHAVNWFFPHYFKESIWTTEKKRTVGVLFYSLIYSFYNTIQSTVHDVHCQEEYLWLFYYPYTNEKLLPFIILIPNKTIGKSRKGKKKHNNRHMISMLAFLRQDAPRYLLLKQLCVFEHTHIHIHIIYLMPSSRVLLSLSIAYRLQSAKRESNEFFKVWMNAVCKITISVFTSYCLRNVWDGGGGIDLYEIWRH